MMMSPAEIAANYRQAKVPSKQIQILADMNCCTKKEIIEVLRAEGEQLPGWYDRKKKTDVHGGVTEVKKIPGMTDTAFNYGKNVPVPPQSAAPTAPPKVELAPAAGRGTEERATDGRPYGSPAGGTEVTGERAKLRSGVPIGRVTLRDWLELQRIVGWLEGLSFGAGELSEQLHDTSVALRRIADNIKMEE